MPHITLPEGLPGIRGLLAFSPETAKPISELTDILLRAPNTLSPGERELIAAYVSHLNGCTYCHASHAAIAACHLQNEALVASAVQDPEHSLVSPKMKALLALAAQVQLGGREVTSTAIVRARTEGASDREIHDTVLIAAAFCLFNRYVDGLATVAPTDPDGYRERGRFVAEHGYTAVLPHVANVPPR
jgi:uncharacterized peroxidase-related enzyme